MNDAGQGLLCGFGDLGSGLAGLAWDFGEPGGLLLDDGEVRPASFAIEESGDDATLELTAGDATVEATLAARDAPLPLVDPDGPGADVTVTNCSAEVGTAGDGPTVRSVGQISRWSSSPLAGAATFRYLSIEGGEGTHLVATAAGRPGAAGHGEERTSAWLLTGEEVTPFEEALISTQYDGDGVPTRIGLELWPEDADQTSRAAATRVAGSSLGGVAAGGSWAGLFRCHTNGSEGLGTYLLWRA